MKTTREPPSSYPVRVWCASSRPRIEEILRWFETASRFAVREQPRARAILTGGVSQLTGLPELAARILNRRSGSGRPLGIAGLPESAKGRPLRLRPGFLVYPQAAHLEHFEPRRTRHLMTGTGYIARVGRWLRESF